ncbi:MAG: DEAD/DEAH box helicase, partial [Caldilinea sp.]|nr:DEAD/DEAH box helicase [Caldilinea sp.]
TTIASQGLEARALLACGHAEGARRTAVDLVRSYPRHAGALAAATSVLAAADDFAAVEEAVAVYLDAKPNDLQGILSMAAAAAATDRSEIADSYLQRLGPGLPAGITVEQLMQWRWVADKMGRRETAASADLELERRQHQELVALKSALSPFIAASDALPEDPTAYLRRISGPELVEMTAEERKRIETEAIRHFGFDPPLRHGQAEIITLPLIRRRSALMVMPTGGGKSLCYQLPALVQSRATLVISPLISLMKGQVEGLPKAAQKRATFINSMLSESELAERMEGVARGDYKLVYAAPERLRQRSFLHALRRAGLDLFVVDEAHCVSMWGHDFRPDYLFIRQARHELGNPPALAVTATAPPLVRDEIVEYISDPPSDKDGDVLYQPSVVMIDIFRPNLHLSALQ